MAYLRIVLCLSIALALWHRALTAQAKPDSSSDTVPQLGGRWHLASAGGPGSYVVTFVQTGNQLRADLSLGENCAGTNVVMLFTLEGGVYGSSVSLRVVNVRLMNGGIDGGLANNCSQHGAFTSSADFRGKLSADGKTIVGPYDYSGSREHVWTFER